MFVNEFNLSTVLKYRQSPW